MFVKSAVKTKYIYGLFFVFTRGYRGLLFGRFPPLYYVLTFNPLQAGFKTLQGVAYCISI